MQEGFNMEYNDYELICMAKENDEVASEILYKKYEPLIANKASSFYKKYGNGKMDYEDFYQEALISFGESITNYNDSLNALFYTFTSVCMENRLNSFTKKINNNKNRLFNEALSYDDINGDNNKVVKALFDNDPLDEVVSKESNNELYNNLKDILTDKELTILNAKLNGLSIQEIANSTNFTFKTVYNAIQRIKNKTKKILNNNE